MVFIFKGFLLIFGSFVILLVSGTILYGMGMKSFTDHNPETGKTYTYEHFSFIQIFKSSIALSIFVLICYFVGSYVN